MGHGSSKPGVTESSDDSTDSSSRLSRFKERLHIHSKPGGTESSSDNTDGSRSSSSRLSRFKQRLHIHRHIRQRGSGSQYQHSKSLAAEEFVGIALIKLINAEMKLRTSGLLVFRSENRLSVLTSLITLTNPSGTLGGDNVETPAKFEISKSLMEKKFLLESNGPRVARISVFETNRLSKNNLVGFCVIDLFEFLTQDSDSDIEVFNLLDPSSPDMVVGKVSLSCSVEDPIETEKSFARRILSVVDYNEDGKLSFAEFSDLINAFGNQLAADKKEELFKAADQNGDNVVSMDELAILLAIQQEKEPLINCCPVCGEILEISDNLNNMIHLTLCFDEGTGNQVMTGGFLTDKQASYGWMFKLSEWAHFSSYDIGLNSGSSASHIVFNEVVFWKKGPLFGASGVSAFVVWS